MADTTKEHELEAIIVGLCDANRQWYDIQELTGVSEDRAKEMANAIDDVFESYFARNGYGE